jgi:EmrB/QacA subfamily drug resistance transporter
MRERSPWAVFALVAGQLVVGTLNFSIVFVAFPEIEETFGADSATVSWTLTAFSITVAALTIPGGWLADRFGRKRLFLLGATLFALGSLLVALAPTIWLLILARVVQAAGVALEGPAAQAIVLQVFPVAKRSTIVGTIGAIGGIFSAIGPAVGGALIDTVGWRWTFAASVPISALTVLLGLRMLPDHRGDPGRGAPDTIGLAMLVVGVASLVLGIVQSDSWGWLDPRTFAVLGIAAVTIPGIVHRSRVHPNPVLALELYQHRNFRIGSALGMVIAGHFGAVYLSFIILMTEVWDLSRFRGGMAVGYITLIAGTLTFFAGRIADRRGHASVIVPGSLLFIVAGAFFLLTLGAERELLTVWLPGATIYAVGVGLAHAATASAAMSAVPVDRLGIGGAMARIFVDIGNAIWVAVAIALQAGAGDTLDGIRRVVATMIPVGVVGALLARRLDPPAAAAAATEVRVGPAARAPRGGN